MRTTKAISFKVIISDVLCKLFANIDIVAFPFDSSQLFHGKIIFISRSRLWTSVLILKWATAVVTRIPPITHNHMIGIQALQSAYMFIYKLLYINTYIWMSGSESKSDHHCQKETEKTASQKLACWQTPTRVPLHTDSTSIQTCVCKCTDAQI